jgi:hypothetical protein
VGTESASQYKTGSSFMKARNYDKNKFNVLQLGKIRTKIWNTMEYPWTSKTAR